MMTFMTSGPPNCSYRATFIVSGNLTPSSELFNFCMRWLELDRIGVVQQSKFGCMQAQQSSYFNSVSYGISLPRDVIGLLIHQADLQSLICWDRVAKFCRKYVEVNIAVILIFFNFYIFTPALVIKLTTATSHC